MIVSELSDEFADAEEEEVATDVVEGSLVAVLLDEPLDGGEVNAQGRRQGFQEVRRHVPVALEAGDAVRPLAHIPVADHPGTIWSGAAVG